MSMGKIKKRREEISKKFHIANVLCVVFEISALDTKNISILSQRSNTALKGQEFYTTNCCRAVYVEKIAQLVLKNFYRTENMLSGAWCCELFSD